MHSASFKSRIVKIQEGRNVDLIGTERKALRLLQIELVSGDAEDVESYSIVERAHKRLMISNVSESSSYIDSKHLLLLSDIC